MNLDILGFLIDNDHYIIDKANDVGLDENAAIGIVKKLIGDGGDSSTLVGKQQYYYEKVIVPLTERVPCEGVIGIIETEDGEYKDTCNGNGLIEDDESLLWSYQEEDFKCQICRYDAEKMG